MSFYTHFHTKGNNIFVRYIDDDGRRHSKLIKSYQPTIFVRTNDETEFTNLNDEPLKPIVLDSIAEAKEYVKKYSDIHGFDIHGNTSWEYAYINERWTDDIRYDESKILTYYLDIETEVGEEFPDPYKAEQRINLISIFDGGMYRLWTFQKTTISTEYDGHQVDIRTFDSEDNMLSDFVRFWSGNYPDILTDWNGERFDLPYLINRIKQRLGDEKVSLLSPTGQIREYNLDGKNVGYELKGIEHLDYMMLFKKYKPGERDFSLDAVCEDILKEKKLPNPEASFKLFYERHWDMFCEYNLRDSALLFKLEQKLKFISLTLTMAYMIKMNYSDVFGTVKPWDTYIQNYLYKQNKFVKSGFSKGNADRQIMGGYVMDPIPGKYDWMVSFDANSLYPSIIRSFNISPETIVQSEDVPNELLPFYDRIHGDELDTELKELTPLLKKYNLSMTVNGQFFRRDSIGIMPLLCGLVYNGRVEVKDEMKDWKRKKEAAPKSEHPEIEKHIASLDAKQNAFKILINSLYGSMASPYFRFFDFRCAEGITSSGQFFIRTVGERAGDYLDSLVGQSGSKQSLTYGDTDSFFLSVNELLKKTGIIEQPVDKIVEAIDQFCEKKIGKNIASSCSHITDGLNCFENHLAVKREKISQSAIFVAKKRYAVLIRDNEGVRLAEPEVSATGLEVKRSSTPSLCRKSLKDALLICLDGGELALQEFVKEFKVKFMASPLSEISVPSGVKGLDRYSDSKRIYQTGCPQHVRATLLYNHYLKTHHLGGKYNPILNGGKMRRVPLLIPNPIGEDTIGFIDQLPEEFGLHGFIDYETLFDKTFLKPLERITESINWQIVKKSTLDDFFA